MSPSGWPRGWLLSWTTALLLCSARVNGLMNPDQQSIYARPNAKEVSEQVQHAIYISPDRNIEVADSTVHTQLPLKSIYFPAKHGDMGGNPFGGSISKEELYFMAGAQDPKWWGHHPQDGECPGEQLVNLNWMFSCAKQSSSHGSNACIANEECKRKKNNSKCCYNGCDDICLEQEKLIHSFCYEAMGAMRYQPGEEFMHGEWWCKCDPSKKSYDEMCTRLDCSIENLQPLGSNEEKSEESEPEETSEDSDETSEEHTSEESDETSEEHTSEESDETSEEHTSEESEETSEEHTSEESDETSEEHTSEESDETSEEHTSEESESENSETEVESEESSDDKKKPKKCKKGSANCNKPKKCKDGSENCNKPKKCKKGSPNCNKPKKCKDGSENCNKPKKCKKGSANCKKPGGKIVKKCKKGDRNCRKPKVKKCKGRKCKKPKRGGKVGKGGGGGGKGGGKKGKGRLCKRWPRKCRKGGKFKYGGKGGKGKKGRICKKGKGKCKKGKKWKGGGKWKGKHGKKIGKKWSWKGKKSVKTRHWKRKIGKKWWKSRKYGVKRRRHISGTVTKKWKVRWTVGKGSCENIWVMGCNGMVLNENMAMELMVAIIMSGYQWPDNFVDSDNIENNAVISKLLADAYLDGYYYGNETSALNWVFWVEGLRKACNTSVGQGVYPVTWASSLKYWENATQAVLDNSTSKDLAYAQNWTDLWFDPLHDTCRRNVWYHLLVGADKRYGNGNAYSFELKWKAGHTKQQCTTNIDFGWLNRFILMFKRYTWTLIIVGAKDGWIGRPYYKLLGYYWQYGARRYKYVLHQCYNIWSLGCSGSEVNETFAREWVKYSTSNGYSWDENFLSYTGKPDLLLHQLDLYWDGLSVINGTDTDQLNWALWYNAYKSVCNATHGMGNEDKLETILQDWSAKLKTKISSTYDNITIYGDWPSVWRYPFRHSCINQLKYYRRFAHNLVGRIWTHSKMEYWLERFQSWDWETVYFSHYWSGRYKQINWGRYYAGIAGHGDCISNWTMECNCTLTNASYLIQWQHLVEGTGFEWPYKFTTQLGNELVQELKDKYLYDRVTDSIQQDDINWAFWFDGWEQFCNGTRMLDEGFESRNWSVVLRDWALDWTDRLDNNTLLATKWIDLWMEPLLYMCNYTHGLNDTFDMCNRTQGATEYQTGSLVTKNWSYQSKIETQEIRTNDHKSAFNEGLCLNVWTSACQKQVFNVSTAEGLLLCLKKKTPTLNFFNYTDENLDMTLNLMSSAAVEDTKASKLIADMKDSSVKSVQELEWKLWLNAWADICTHVDPDDVTLDDVLVVLENNFDRSTILNIGIEGNMDDWKKAWIQPWTGPCKGASFSCEYEYDYNDYDYSYYSDVSEPTWYYGCMRYINGTMQSFNWTSDGNDWKDECGFDSTTEFSWSDVSKVNTMWANLCNVDSGENPLNYSQDNWDSDFGSACEDLVDYIKDNTGGGSNE